MTTEYKPPLADSIFLEDKSKLITNPSWLLWLSKIANLLTTIPAEHVNNATALTIAAGDLLKGASANTLDVLSKGTANTKLFMNAGATAPEWSSGISIISSTRKNTNQTYADQSYTSVGFKPSAIICFVVNGDSFSSSVEKGAWQISITSGTSRFAMSRAGNLDELVSTTSYFIAMYGTTNYSSCYRKAVVKSYDADGFTLTWSGDANNPGLEITWNLVFLCFR